jgi:stage II sporulation protein D
MTYIRCLITGLIVFFVACLCLPDKSYCSNKTIKILLLSSPDDFNFIQHGEKLGQVNGQFMLNGTLYKGTFTIKQTEQGIIAINELPFEEYIEGVVSSETGECWHIEALKCQAVIARTYALFHKNINKGKEYHLTSTVLHQQYSRMSSNPLIQEAVEETKGEILTYNNAPIEAFYHSTCGGRTELPEEIWSKGYPYITSQVYNDDISPYFNWERRFMLEDVAASLMLKGIKNIEIHSLTSTGRVKTLRVSTLDGITIILAKELRRRIGYKELPSTNFTLTVKDGEVIFNGSGYGHGVGLCQYGALQMALEGKKYTEILKFFYPQTKLLKR